MNYIYIILGFKFNSIHDPYNHSIRNASVLQVYRHLNRFLREYKVHYMTKALKVRFIMKNFYLNEYTQPFLITGLAEEYRHD